MPEPIGAHTLLTDADFRALSSVGSPEVIAAVCVVNQARSVVRVVEAVADGVGAVLADRKGAVIVVEAGFRSEAVDAVQAWTERRAPDPPVRCIRIAGPPTRSRALLGALAVADRLGSSAGLVVDAGLIGLTPNAAGRLVQPILGGVADWASPAYSHTVMEGTLTTNLLAPMARAMYGRRLQQVLGGCAAFSRHAVSRLMERDDWDVDLADHGLEVRLAIDAVTAGDPVVEVHLGRKVVDGGVAPPDLATTLARTVGPFFGLLDRYRTTWSEMIGSLAVPVIGDPPTLVAEGGDVAVDRMVRAFQLGLKDLLPLWEQALQEDTLSSLYPLGLLPPDEFVFPADQWARVVFDFAVAHHEQRLPRDHLLRSLTPLYLGRVAAFLRQARATPPARLPALLDDVGRAFEVEKAGLAARWR
jgi:hypothetical protein